MDGAEIKCDLILIHHLKILVAMFLFRIGYSPKYSARNSRNRIIRKKKKKSQISNKKLKIISVLTL